MTTYTIRPTSKGFGVFHGRTWLGRPKLVEEHDRLYSAEMHALHLVTQDYHKLLDYDRLSNQTMSTDMMKPRASEEHVYTALVLAGKRPPGGDTPDEEYAGGTYAAPIARAVLQAYFAKHPPLAQPEPAPLLFRR